MVEKKKKKLMEKNKQNNRVVREGEKRECETIDNP